MSGTMMIGCQMFTIEQIELIRRLRNSGISREQVIEAFDSLERLDRELGMLYNIPASYTTHMSSNNRDGVNSSVNFRGSSLSSVTPSVTTPRIIAVGNENMSHLRRQLSHNQNMHSQSDVDDSQSTPQNEFLNRGIKRPHIDSIDLDSIESPSSFDEDNSNLSTSAHNSLKDEDPESTGKKENDFHRLVTEIRSFVSQSEVKKEVISAMSGQSLALIDEFLHGDYRDIPSNCFQSICAWYFAYRKSMTPPTLQSKSSTPNQPPPYRLTFADGQEVLIATQRRERFTFREKHLEILEQCFKENAYPSQEQREAIANMCNTAISNNRTRLLLDREKVTNHIILNWFANRRKEVKRIAREEGISESSVVLPSRLARNKIGPIEFEYQESTPQDLQNLQHNDFEQAENTTDDIDDIIILKQELPE